MPCIRLPWAVVNRSGNIDRDRQGPCEDAPTEQNRQKRNKRSGTERNEFLHHVDPPSGTSCLFQRRPLFPIKKAFWPDRCEGRSCTLGQFNLG
jgi:hypothetical protein